MIADPVDPYLELEIGSSFDHIRAASVQYRIAIGPHAGRKALTLFSLLRWCVSHTVAACRLKPYNLARVLKLRAQLKRTEEEGDILKKAARYFAQSPE